MSILENSYRVTMVSTDGQATTTELAGYWAETLADKLFHDVAKNDVRRARYTFVAIYVLDKSGNFDSIRASWIDSNIKREGE